MQIYSKRRRSGKGCAEGVVVLRDRNTDNGTRRIHVFLNQLHEDGNKNVKDTTLSLLIYYLLLFLLRMREHVFCTFVRRT